MTVKDKLDSDEADLKTAFQHFNKYMMGTRIRGGSMGGSGRGKTIISSEKIEVSRYLVGTVVRREQPSLLSVHITSFVMNSHPSSLSEQMAPV